jgi:DNA mismatch repair protein MutS2
VSFQEALTKLEFDKVLRLVARYTTSEGGRSLLFSAPVLKELNAVKRELSLVTEMKSLIEREGEPPLSGIREVEPAVRRASVTGALLTPRELLEITETLHAARAIRSYFVRHRETAPVLCEMYEVIYTDKVLEYNIEQAIDPSGAIRSSASKELGRIRRAIIDKYELLRKRLQSILRSVSDLGLTQDDIITTREGRMVIPVKTAHQKQVPGFIHSSSASGATVFVEPTETLELNNQITDLQFQERREIDRILGELSSQVGAVRDDLLMTLSRLAHIDSLQARARYSIEALCAEPTVSAGLEIHLRGARHPLLIAAHGYEKTVPLDLDLGVDYHTLVISGPNAGGKSVTMKCVGLLTLMAQSGLHIPALPESEVRIFRKLFVDIGDEQSIENDLSTFSSHLTSLKQIVENADRDTLVLVDEIGTGTDPAEGGALAAAILEALTERKAMTIATTHHGFLKVFAHQAPGVGNGAMEFDQATLEPTYRFKGGIPGSSYALEMARRLKLDEAILGRSTELLGHRESRMESLLMELEAATQRYKRESEALSSERDTIARMIREYEAKLAAVAAEVRNQKRVALEEARRIVDDANALVERSVREIREANAARDVLRHAKSEISAFREKVGKEQETDLPAQQSPTPEIRVGMTVSLGTGGETGTVESLIPGRNAAFVQFGNIRMKVNLADLVAATSQQAVDTRRPGDYSQDAGPPPHEVDVRGMTGDEAVQVVDKLLDSAILGGLHRVDIIHGKGTGALRKRVSEFLSGHPRVRSFRLGEWNEGGSGATVVELE